MWGDSKINIGRKVDYGTVYILKVHTYIKTFISSQIIKYKYQYHWFKQVNTAARNMYYIFFGNCDHQTHDGRLST